MGILLLIVTIGYLEVPVSPALWIIRRVTRSKADRGPAAGVVVLATTLLRSAVQGRAPKSPTGNPSDYGIAGIGLLAQ